MNFLELKIPPPVVALLTGIAMWAGARISPRIEIAAGIRITIAVALAVLGVGIALAGISAFRQAGTTVTPLRPETATSLVVRGAYRYSRNPMYVGLATVLVGWAVYLAAPVVLLGPAVFVGYITRFQIVPEERALGGKFGEQFVEYQNNVRRWL